VLDGQEVSVASYLINQLNYFRLRDIAILLDFNVSVNSDGAVVIDTASGY
jgi:hypothetical protein